VDSRFGSIDGVVRTTSGYTGGTAPDPTYQRLGDHTESVEVEYDPARVSYSDLLRIFWESHDPTSQAWSRQYRNAVFYHNEEQKRLAIETRAEVEKRLGKAVNTDVEDAGPFYPAEDYHQKYILKGYADVWTEIRSRYATEEEAVASTAAARANGYLGGYGSPTGEDLEALGLTPGAAVRLRAAGRRGAE
jgi:peptide-methionine (S)-S-oxide reductase